MLEPIQTQVEVEVEVLRIQTQPELVSLVSGVTTGIQDPRGLPEEPSLQVV